MEWEENRKKSMFRVILNISQKDMKSKNGLCGLPMAVVLQLGVLAGSAQTNRYLFSGSETNITLNPSRKMAARPRAGCLPGLLLLAGLLATVTPLRADNPPTYLFQIDTNAVPGGAFYPTLLALDSGNNVYVVDESGLGRVVKFDSNGKFVTQWGSYGSGNGQFEYPAGIAVDSSNNVYVVDSGNARVEKFDSNGNYLTQWGSYGNFGGFFEYPAGIAVDSGNDVYVVDQLGNGRVQKFDRNGNFLTEWNVYGLEIAVDGSNDVYVVDSIDYDIEKFSNNGNLLTYWGGYGFGNGQFYNPEGIAADSNNHVYVVDSVINRIEKFSGNGNYLTQWESVGISDYYNYSYPKGIAVDNTGNWVYVADSANNRIQVFYNYYTNRSAPFPAFIVQQPPSQTVQAGINVTLSVGLGGTAPFSYQWNSNNVAVPGATNATFTLTNVNSSESGNYSVLVTNINGSTLSSNAVLTVLPAADFVPPTFAFEIDASAMPGGFQPYYVALDRATTCYVTDDNNNRVLKFAGNGTYLTQWGSLAPTTASSNIPKALRWTAATMFMWLMQTTTAIEKFDGSGNYLTQWGGQW